MKAKYTLALLLLCLASPLAAQKFEGLAATPPMGWNSWNTFQGNISESLIKEMADAIVSSGMQKAGYRFIVIDDGWEAPERDAQGNLVPDPTRFPHGMKAIGDYLHSRGFLFGIHNCAGTKTCAGLPGGRGHEFQDARAYASWGVDYLKYDWCNHGTANAEETYKTMRDALHAAGRPIVFSLCEWGDNKPWTWARDVGHLWRTTGDIMDCYDCQGAYSLGWKFILELQVGLEQYAGPGHWNDPDMLEVGNPGLNEAESRAHFSLWAMLAAPLMAGNDARKMPEQVRDILNNPEVIAIDQDALGQQGRRVKKNGDVEVWSKQLADGGRAVVLLNRGAAAANIDFLWTDIGYPARVAATVRDLWTAKEVSGQQGSYSALVPSHGVVMVTVRP